MKAPRFLITSEQAARESFLLDPKESRHAKTVLRLKRGDAVELFDGRGRTLDGVVTGEEGGCLSIAVLRPKADRAADALPLTLAAAVIKPDAMEWMIEKACELGAGRIVPLLTGRVVIKMSAERWQSKLVRWRKIAAESCKQCGRSQLPEIAAPRAFDTFVKSFDAQTLALLPTLTEAGEELSQILQKEAPRPAVVLIGPEGDFTRQEVGSALRAGARAVSLGPLVLRSETAALYALSLLSAWPRRRPLS